MRFQFKSLISSAFIAITMLLAWTSCTQETKEVTIYKNAFTVTFDANGGTGRMQSQTFLQDTEQALTKNGFSAPSGRVFGGWTDDCDSTDKVYSDNQFIKVSQNVTLYALWIAKEGDGTGRETKGWPNVTDSFESYTFNSYRDTSIYPGDDFYNYSLGSWADNPNQVGVWKTTELGQAVAKDDKGGNLNQVSLSEYVKKQFVENIIKDAANDSIIKKISDKYDAITDSFALKKAALSAHLTEIDNADNSNDFLRIAAQDIVEGSTYINLEIIYESRKSFKMVFSSELSKELMDLYNKNATLTFEEIVENYSEDSIDLEDVMSILNIADDASADDIKSEYAKAFLMFGDTNDGQNDTDNQNEDVLCSNIRNILGINDVKSYNNLYYNINTLGQPEGMKLDNAKKALKLMYVLSNLPLMSDIDNIFSLPPFKMLSLKYFEDNYDKDNANKQYVVNMCKEFQNKFIERLKANTWMSDTSKEAAVKKAEKILFFVGYPSEYSNSLINLSSDKDSLLDIIHDLQKQYTVNIFAKIKEADEQLAFELSSVYSFDPLMANAMYSQNDNSVNIFALNIIAPICVTQYADAYNYAILGATTIGHELCHAFDASGSMYNENGEIADWWTVSDKLRYEAKKNEITELFNMFTTPVSFTNLDGKFTLEENMADFGGLVTAYDIFVEKKINEGFAGEKLIEQKKMFFQSFALAWSSLDTDEDMKKNLTIDPHSPAMFRVNGTICQMDEWYELYDVRFGDKYYLDPNQRTVLW